MKKLGIAIASILVACLVGVVIYFSIPKEEKYNLTLSVEDIVVKVGETKSFEFECSIEEAFITAQVEDTSTAIVDISGENYTVHGHKFGTTRLTIIAKYKTQTKKVVVEVKVVAGSLEAPETNDNNGSGDTGEDTGNSESSEDTNKEGSTEKPSTPDIPQGEETYQIRLTGVMNCTIEGNKVVVSEKLAVFSISVGATEQSGLSFNYDDTKLFVSLEENNAWALKVLALEVGTFDLEITINEIEYVIEILRV